MKESIVRSVEGLYEQRTLELVKIAVRKGFTPLQILDWLRIGMERVGDHYEKCDYFIADLIFAGIIFQEVMDLDELKALYAMPAVPRTGKIVVASVYGDCHDIGKNILPPLQPQQALKSSTSALMFLPPLFWKRYRSTSLILSASAECNRKQPSK